MENRTFENKTDPISSDTQSMFTPFWIFIIVWNFLVCIVVTFLSVITILVLRRHYHLRNVASNILIVNLAVIDIIFACFNGLVTWFIIMMPEEFPYHVCVTTEVGFTTITLLEIISTFVNSIDRYLYMKLPMAYNRIMTTTKAKRLVLLVWVFSISAALIPFLASLQVEGQVCSALILSRTYQYSAMIPSCLIFIIVVLITFCMHVSLFRIIKDLQNNHRPAKMHRNISHISLGSFDDTFSNKDRDTLRKTKDMIVQKVGGNEMKLSKEIKRKDVDNNNKWNTNYKSSTNIETNQLDLKQSTIVSKQDHSMEIEINLELKKQVENNVNLHDQPTKSQNTIVNWKLTTQNDNIGALQEPSTPKQETTINCSITTQTMKTPLPGLDPSNLQTKLLSITPLKEGDNMSNNDGYTFIDKIMETQTDINSVIMKSTAQKETSEKIQQEQQQQQQQQQQHQLPQQQQHPFITTPIGDNINNDSMIISSNESNQEKLKTDTNLTTKNHQPNDAHISTNISTPNVQKVNSTIQNIVPKNISTRKHDYLSSSNPSIVSNQSVYNSNSIYSKKKWSYDRGNLYTTRMLFFLLGVYIVLWSPSFVVKWKEALSDQTDFNLGLPIAMTLATANSIVNFFVYSMRVLQIRNVVKLYIRKWCPCYNRLTK